jgi:hypothetical protein
MVIVPSRSGRLGNRLQLSAYAAAVALECGQTASLLCLGRYRSLFAGSRDDALCRLPACRPSWRTRIARWGLALVARFLPGISGRRACVLDEPATLARIAKARTLVLRGYYFYAPQLLRKHAPAIRRYFQLAPPYAGRVAQFLRRSRSRAENIVGVHVRQGDYATYRGGEHFFTLADYAQVMRQMRALLAPASVHFVVCSDASHPPSAFGDLSWEAGPGSAIEDLYALAGCDYVLGPCSTFNRWSAFVGNVPRYELRDPSRRIRLEDFVPPTNLTVPEPYEVLATPRSLRSA